MVLSSDDGPGASTGSLLSFCLYPFLQRTSTSASTGGDFWGRKAVMNAG